MCIAAVSDASHGNGEVYLDDWHVRETFRSQGAKLIFLSSLEAVTAEQAHVHLLSFSSTVLKRVVNSTTKAETYQLTDVVEGADLLRAALADAHGVLDPSNWETSASQWMRNVWFTDCRSCYDTLQKPINKTVDERLGIELAALRQNLWRAPGHSSPDSRMLEEKPQHPTDIVRWIDTAVMVADSLTKQMRSTFLLDVLTTNVWDFAQTDEARATKARKQQQRRRKPEDSEPELGRDSD